MDLISFILFVTSEWDATLQLRHETTTDIPVDKRKNLSWKFANDMIVLFKRYDRPILLLITAKNILKIV